MKIFENDSIPFSLKKTITMSAILIFAIIVGINIFSNELIKIESPTEVIENNEIVEVKPQEEHVKLDELTVVTENNSEEKNETKVENEKQTNVEVNKDDIQKVEDKAEEIKEEIKPVKEIASRNTTTSRGAYVDRTGGVPETYKEVKDMKATAYCLCKKCCGKSVDNPEYGVTRSGLKIVPNTGMKVIAVDPKVIPLGTWVYVEGLNGAPDYGYAIAADTGGAIKNNKIDLYMDSHDATYQWGIKDVKVYILKDE
jgi:3D (Asp-Asp-Asp) domain-containing protein